MRCYNCKNSNLMRVDDDYKCKRRPTCIQEDKQRIEKHSKFNIKPGSKIRFKDEKRFYNVRACDGRFIIAYRNWRDTYYYVICDLKECIRGADNYSSSGGYYDYRDCLEIELREALYKLHLTEPILLKDCKHLDDDIRYKWKKEINCFSEVPEEQQWIQPLEVSHRRWTELDIEEVR